MSWDMEEIREKVLSLVNNQTKNTFKPRVLEKISDRMIKKAVEDALKGVTSLDLALATEFTDFFCEKCGECCRKNDPILIDMEDIIVLASFLGVEHKLVIANYTKQLKNGWLSLQTPCPFLQEDNLCSIYPAHPKVCKTFPFAEKEGHITLNIYPYCNFVINVIIRKAIGFLTKQLIESEFPDVHSAIKEYEKKLQKFVPEDKIQQIIFARQLIRKWTNAGA